MPGGYFCPGYFPRDFFPIGPRRTGGIYFCPKYFANRFFPDGRRRPGGGYFVPAYFAPLYFWSRRAFTVPVDSRLIQPSAPVEVTGAGGFFPASYFAGDYFGGY